MCAIYSSFLQRGYDQIVHDVVLQKLPVRFAMDRAGLVGADGATHSGFADVTYMGVLPNMIMMAVSPTAPCPPHCLSMQLQHPVGHPSQRWRIDMSPTRAHNIWSLTVLDMLFALPNRCGDVGVPATGLLRLSAVPDLSPLHCT